MKFQIVSDLHLEFAPITLNNAGSDVLILSGDICVADYLARSVDSPYRKKADAFIEFFQDCASKWNHVLYVLGNHEHYSGRFDKTAQILRSVLPSNVILLDNETITLDGIKFAGGTLWTDFDNRNPVAMSMVEDGLTDYRLIKLNHRKLRATDILYLHLRTREFIAREKPDVFIGHHGPSWQSIIAEYRTGRYAHLNPGYVSNLDEFVADSGIKLWTHGHVHSSHDYSISNTRVVANPRGYDTGGRPENPNFNPEKVFEI